MADQAEDTKIAFKVSADGVKEAADGLNKVGDALERQQAAVKAMDEAMAASGFLARLASYKAEAASLNAQQDQNAASFKKMTSAIEQTTAAFEVNTTEVRAKSRDVVEVVAQLAHGFSDVVPAAGAFRETLDITVGSLRGVLGLLGGGPGILLGGLVAGIGLLGAVMGAAKKDADELAKATAENTSAFSDYIDAINESRGKVSAEKGKETGEKTLQEAFAKGSASLDQYDTEIAVLQQKMASNEANMKLDIGLSWDELQKRASVVIPQLRNENEGYQEQINLLKQRREVASEYNAAEKQNSLDKKALEDALAQAGATGGKANKTTTVDFNAPEAAPAAKKPVDEASLQRKRLDENAATIQKLRDQQADYADQQVEDQKGALKVQFDAQVSTADDALKTIQAKYAQSEIDHKALIHLDLDAERSDIEQQIGQALDNVHTNDLQQTLKVEDMRRDALKQTRDEFMQLEQEKFDAIEKNLQAEKATRTQVNQSMMALGTTLGQLTAKQLSEAVKGHKVQAAMIVEGIGDAMVAEGVRVMFQGAASLLLGNYAAGGGLIAVGAAELAAGLALGAAGAAMQPPTATASDGANANSATPVRDTAQASNGADSNRGPTVIYIDMPTVVSPSAEDGMRVRQAIDAASRVYGAPV